MDLDTLEARWREKIDDEETPYLFSSADFKTWINEAVDEACIRKLLIFDKTTEAVTQIAVVAATSAYSLHESVIKVEYAYLDDGSQKYPLDIILRANMNDLSSTWRTDDERPDAIIIDDKKVELNSAVDASYTLYLEVYRTPVAGSTDMSDGADEPEIGSVHHKHLLDWPTHVALDNIDADSENQKYAYKALVRFERYFGKRPKVNMAKRTSVPQQVKAWW